MAFPVVYDRFDRPCKFTTGVNWAALADLSRDQAPLFNMSE